MTKFALAAIAAALIAAPAVSHAAPPPPMVVQDTTASFERTDSNQDDVITLAEARGAYPTLTEVLYSQADSNDDGVLDETEWAALEGLTAAFGDNNDGERRSRAPDLT